MRALFFAYYFPPLGGIGSLRAAGLARYLPEAGVETVVVAPRTGTYGHDDSIPAPVGASVVRTGTLEPGIVVRRVRGRAGASGGAASAGAPAGGGFLKGLAQRLLHVPDSNVGWVPAAVRAGLAVARESRPDVVFSSSPPLSAHLAAAVVARRLRVPHVADFRDFLEVQHLFPGARERLDRRFEEYVLGRVTGLTAPYAGILDALGARTSAPGLVLRNGFEEEDFAGPAPARAPGPFRLVHVGSTYCDRTSPVPLFRAAARLAQAGADLRLRFVGHVDPGLEGAAAAAGLADRVELAGFSPHETAIREMRTADALLLMLWAREEPVIRGLVLGKTFEYLRSGRPIVALGSASGDTATLLGELGGARFAAPDDGPEIERILGDLLAGARPEPADPARLSRYSRRAQAALLAEWLRQRL